MSYWKKPRKVGELIKGFVDHYPRKKELKRGMVLAAIPELAGEKMASQITKAWFREDKLCLKVPNQGWRQEIHMQRSMLQKKLNREVREDIVKEIIVY